MTQKRKPSQKRIEPTFEPAKRKPGGPQVHLEASDRVVGTGPRKKSSSKAKKPRTRAARSAGKAKKTKRGSGGGFFSFFGKTVYWSLVLALWGGIGLAGIVGYYAAQLPSSASWQVPERPPNAKITSMNGDLVANRGATGGANVALDDMSPWIPRAVIAIEDHRFHSHFGFDPIGFTRAMARNISAGRLVQGGSTLTQQLAKNLFLEPERTVERKVQELIIAFWLETQYSKDEILELYLNRVYFGSGATGVDAAARRYFDKSASQVTLAEAALLAGLLKAPSRLSPARNPQAASDRAQTVLSAMKREAFISDGEALAAMSVPARKAKRYWSGAEHYFADAVMKRIPELIGEMRTDIVVETTVDLNLQRAAEAAIADNLSAHGKKRKVSQGALVSMTPRGAVRALVGGKEYADSQYNRAIESKRQPGSAFKTFVWLAALEQGRTPESVRNDAPVKIGKWTPVNYDRKYRGPVTLANALSKSLNTVAAQLVMETGPKTVVDLAGRMGIRSKLTPNASIALGTSEVTLMELTSAYAPLANGGARANPHLIRRITDRSGKILYERQSDQSLQVVHPRILGMINSILKQAVEKGTGKAARLKGREVAGKTGTTQKAKDGLFVGYTANLVTGVWFGNDDGAPTNKVTGGSLPAQAWHEFMRFAHIGVPVSPLPGKYVPEVKVAPPIATLPRNVIDNESTSITSSRTVVQTPSRNGTTPRGRHNEGQLVEPQRRSLSELNGSSPRPSASVGGQQQEKPKTILDILFPKS